MPQPVSSAGATRRAYSVFSVKSVNDDQRIIEGIASTPTTDRMGDIVEPMGAQFTLPLPLLWMHDSHEPIGHVTAAKATKDGISITAQLASIAEPGTLKNRLDEAWQSLKIGLVRGLSIGFAPIDSEPIKNSWSERYLKWDWLELSCVTIAANAEASILSVKSADCASLAASGQQPRAVVRLSSSPGVAGIQLPKGDDVKTIAEQIAAFEAKRAASVARQTEIMGKAGEEGRTLEATETQEYDGLAAEVKAIDEHLVRLKAHEAALVSRAQVVTAQSGTGEGAPAPVRTELRTIGLGPKLEPGQKFARYVMAMCLAKGSVNDAISIAQGNKAWMDSSPDLVPFMKTAVPAGDTTTSGWASQLVYANNLAGEFVDYLRPLTILGKLTGLRRVPFNVRMGTQTAGATGNWVGQGQAIPMSKLTVGSTSLGIAKAAGLVAVDDELVRSSSPSAELLVRDDLAKTLATFLDVAFIDPNQGGQLNIAPASVTYGLTPVDPTGVNAAAIATDIASVFSSAIAANLNPATGVWVMSPTTALALSLMLTSLGQPQYPAININGGTWFGLPVIVSQSAYIAGSPQFGNMIVLILPNEILLADDGQVTIDISNEASLEMLVAPTGLSTGATAAAQTISMFQTASMAIRAIRYINWVKRRTQAVAFIQAANYH